MARKKKWFCGIDPGVNGAYAFYNSEKEYYAFDYKNMQMTKDTIKHFKPEFTIIEHLWGTSGQGVDRVTTMIENYGQYQGILIGLDLNFSKLTPTNWRKVLEIPTKCDKNTLLEVARRIFPDAKLEKNQDTDKAESLLMALSAHVITLEKIKR